METDQNYIQFTLGEQDYALQMSHVREIIKPLEVRKLLGSPNFVLGVVKLRDEIVTIIDLHEKFNLAAATENGEPRIIILEYDNENIGLNVDNVVEIVEDALVDSVPTTVHCGTVREIIKQADRLIPILDINKLFTEDITVWLNDDNC